LYFLISGIGFIGCGGPPAPQVKEVITYSSGSTMTEAHSYTSNDELKRVVYSTSGRDTEDRLELSYRDGKMSKLEFHDNVSKDSRANPPDIMSIKFGYSEDLVTAFSLRLTELPEAEIKGEMGYNSDDTLADLDIEISAGDSDSRDRAAYSFDYTSDSLFDKISFKSDEERETTDFEYNSDDLISEIRHRSDSGRPVEHEFSYNDDGQLVEYESRNEECELSYNEDDLVKEIDCTDSGGRYTTIEISYFEGESVEGMIPRIPDIGFGEFFSLDGKPLTPEDFAEPLSIFSLLDW
jgi:YD repeat-containing protein